MHLFPDFTIDTSIINTNVYPSFLRLHYWHQCYQYDCLSILPQNSILTPALSIRLLIHLSPDFTNDTSVNTTVYPSFLRFHYWHQCYQYDCLSVFPPTSILTPVLSIRLFIQLSPDFNIDTSVINRNVYPSFPDFNIDSSVINKTVCPSFLRLH